MSLGKEMSLILGWDSHVQVLKHSAVNCLGGGFHGREEKAYTHKVIGILFGTDI